MRQVTLSFDNGPNAEITPRVLDVLRSRAVLAHFFVLVKELTSVAGRDLVQRAHAEGHGVGNHSFTHSVPLGEDLRSDAVDAEIVATERLLEPLAPGPKRFRPFGGGGAIGPHLLSPRAIDYLVAHGYSCVLWNSVPRDWVDPEGWPERALGDCAGRAHTLVVLHDVPNACLARLEDFIDRARGLGVEFTSALPLACVPIVDGRVTGDLDAIVARSKAGRSD